MKENLNFILVAISSLFFTFSYSQENYKKYEEYLPSSKCGEVIHYNYYSVSYCEEKKTSEWTIHIPLKGVVRRAKSFTQDPSGRGVSPYNYKGSGFDRGHMVPAADMKLNETSMRESFFMTNVLPQNAFFNRVVWKRLESLFRTKTLEWLKDKDNLTIITGHFGEHKEKFGPDEVPVPTHFYKVAFDMTKNRAIAFLIENKKGIKPLSDYAISIDSLEKLTGIDFFYKLDKFTQFKLEKLETSIVEGQNIDARSMTKKKQENEVAEKDNKREIDIKNWFYDLDKEKVVSNKRVALVIGNTDYKIDSYDLKNPVNDATLMKKSLEMLGFKTKLKLDLNRSELREELIKFKLEQKESDFSLIYYAGHAFQDDSGYSFLIPTDFVPGNDLENAALSINPFLKFYEASEKPTLFILDACRVENNSGLTKPLVEDPINIKLAYSTSFGKTASDNSYRSNTIYTETLSKMLKIDGLTIHEILYNTTRIVLDVTNENQVPAYYFGLKVDPLQFKKTNNKQ